LQLKTERRSPGSSDLPSQREDIVQDVNWVALGIFVPLFAFITWLGFAAAHWRRGDLDVLHEWGLAGRRFGTIITWFLVGGDLYTAYTFIAVPALAFGAGPSLRYPTRSSSIRSCFSHSRDCGTSVTGTATSPWETSCADGSATAGRRLR
jgi:hypothetical protein